MKTNSSIRKFLIAGLICGLLLIALTNLLQGVSGRSRGIVSSQQTDDQAVVQAIRREGLHGAAKLKGHYVADFDPHWDIGQFDTEELTKYAAAVVVGVVTRKLGTHQSENALVILTDYEVAVQEAMKGNVLSRSTIIVSLPGGSVQFEDGTTAELRTPTFEHVRAGGVYTFFLTELEKPSGTYDPTAGPQGVVELCENGSVKSHARETDPIAVQTKQISKQSFLRALRRLAKKWPNKEKCCS